VTNGSKSKPSDIFDARYPARRILKLIGDKWTPIVLYCLSGGVRRFNELQHHIPDISKKMLIQVLRKLEASGLVDRKVYPVVPPKTEYTLTEAGRRLHEPVALLCRWAAANTALLDKIDAASRKSPEGPRQGRCVLADNRNLSDRTIRKE
jgi:DNA-binding HxlR family transcriptional regulator